MYNSIIVRSLMSIWNALAIGYKHSLLNRLVVFLLGNISNLRKGSYVIRFFTSNRSLWEESLFYAIFCSLIDLINRLINSIRNWVERYNSGSFVYNTVSRLFGTERNMIQTFSLFFMAFGLGIVVNNILRGYYSGRSYIISLILIILSVIGLTQDIDVRDILKGSYAFRLIESIFTIDEEVDKWW